MIIKQTYYDNDEVMNTWFLSVCSDRIFLHRENDSAIVSKSISRNPKYIEWLIENKYRTEHLWSSGKWFLSDEHHDNQYYIHELKQLLNEDI